MSIIFTSIILTALCLAFLDAGRQFARHLGNITGGLAARRHRRFGYPAKTIQWYDFVRNQSRSSAKALLLWLLAWLGSGFLLLLLHQPDVLWGRGWFAFLMAGVTAFYAAKAIFSSGMRYTLSYDAAVRDRSVVMAATKCAVALLTGMFLATI